MSEFAPILSGFTRGTTAPSAPVQPPAPPVSAPPAAGQPDAGGGVPVMSFDMSDPANLVVVTAVVTAPLPVVRRFERARQRETSNMAVVVAALKANLPRLPELAAWAREAAAGPDRASPFAWRTMRRGPKVHTLRIPIRPLAGELAVMDALVEWVGSEIGAVPRSLGGPMTRSELVTVALDAYLPKPAPRTRKPAGQDGAAGGEENTPAAG